MERTTNFSIFTSKMTSSKKLNDKNIFTCATLKNILDIPMVSVYIYRCNTSQSYSILDTVIHDATISILKNDCSNLMRRRLIQKYIGTEIKECEINYHIVQHTKVIASFNLNMLDKTVELENSMRYYWDCQQCQEIIKTKSIDKKDTEVLSDLLCTIGLTSPTSFYENKTLEHYIQSYPDNIQQSRKSYEEVSSIL